MGALGYNTKIKNKVNLNNEPKIETKNNSSNKSRDKEKSGIDEKEKEIKISKNNNEELNIKCESDLEEEEEEKDELRNELMKIDPKITMYEPENETKIKEPKLEKTLKMKFDEQIYRIYGLSNERIAVIYTYKNILKIYSLKNGKFINKIEHEYIKNVTELKNRDLIICTEHFIYIYKLSNKKYELYQTINEFEQGTNIVKRINSKQIKDYYHLNSICELMNGNLVSCNTYGIKIYTKEKNEYKLLSMEKIIDEVKFVVEIKKNILVIFHLCRHCISVTFHYLVFTLYLYDIEKKEIKELNNCTLLDRYFYVGQLTFNYIINNNYLFVKYGLNLDIYDINQNMELIYKNNYHSTGRGYFNPYFSVKKFFCNFEGELFVGENQAGKIQIFAYKNDNFIEYKEFPFNFEDLRGIIKYKRKFFIIYNDKEIYLLKNINNK